MGSGQSPAIQAQQQQDPWNDNLAILLEPYYVGKGLWFGNERSYLPLPSFLLVRCSALARRARAFPAEHRHQIHLLQQTLIHKVRGDPQVG